MKQLQQLQKALIEGGLVAHLDDKNTMMLVSHRFKSITRMDFLKAVLRTQQHLIEHLDLVEKDGLIFVYPHNTKRRPGNTRGPKARNKGKMYQFYCGPILDEKMEKAQQWAESMSPEKRAVQWTLRWEDWHRDQLEALERSAGNDSPQV